MIMSFLVEIFLGYSRVTSFRPIEYDIPILINEIIAPFLSIVYSRVTFTSITYRKVGWYSIMGPLNQVTFDWSRSLIGRVPS